MGISGGVAASVADGRAVTGDRSTLAAFRRTDPARFLSTFRRRGDGRALDRDGLPADGNRRVAAFLSAFPAAWRRPLPTGAPSQATARPLRRSGAPIRRASCPRSCRRSGDVATGARSTVTVYPQNHFTQAESRFVLETSTNLFAVRQNCALLCYNGGVKTR